MGKCRLNEYSSELQKIDSKFNTTHNAFKSGITFELSRVLIVYIVKLYYNWLVGHFSYLSHAKYDTSTNHFFSFVPFPIKAPIFDIFDGSLFKYGVLG